MKKVVVIGGGTGVFNVLRGLKEYPYQLTAIVTVSDNGGSSGILREEFGVLPPGDIRRALVALSSSTPLLAKLFNYRFKNGQGLKGHSFGNLFLTALERITGSFPEAIKEAGKILGIKGEIIPVSLDKTRLFAELENGYLVVGETNIDIPKHDGHLRIKRIFLNPPAKANPQALKAIKNADVIIVGPGDLYTSILPNFLVRGIKNAFRRSSALKIYICNIMTKYGETTGFTAKDFLSTLEKYVGLGTIDYFIVNSEKPQQRYLKKYQKEHAVPVRFCKSDFQQRSSKRKKLQVISAKVLKQGRLLRHDPKKLAKILSNIIEQS